MVVLSSCGCARAGDRARVSPSAASDGCERQRDPRATGASLRRVLARSAPNRDRTRASESGRRSRRHPSRDRTRAPALGRRDPSPARTAPGADRRENETACRRPTAARGPSRVLPRSSRAKHGDRRSEAEHSGIHPPPAPTLRLRLRHSDSDSDLPDFEDAPQQQFDTQSDTTLAIYNPASSSRRDEDQPNRPPNITTHDFDLSDNDNDESKNRDRKVR